MSALQDTSGPPAGHRKLMGGHQPHYLPTAQYFAKIAACDLFVVSDDVDFVPKEWQNRNRVPGSNGYVWLTVPLAKEGAALCQKRVSGGPWPRKHVETLRYLYRGQPGWPLLDPVVDRIRAVREGDLLADLCIDLMALLLDVLQIDTPWVRASQMGAQRATVADVSAKLAAQMVETGCTAYLSGQSGPEYMDTRWFAPGSLFLFEWQPHPAALHPQASVVDLIAREGPLAPYRLGEGWVRPWR